MIAEKTILDQLLDIYRQTKWQDQSIKDEVILNYYQYMLDKGLLYTIVNDGELIGYYERRFKDDKCWLVNIWATPKERYGWVFKKLSRHFFDTMPLNIKYVWGDKQKLNGKFVIETISKARR